MPSSRYTSSYILAVAALSLSLGACASPNSFPDGYTYHNKQYKSQTPPPSPKFTPEERSAMGPEQAEQFRQSIHQLVEKLTVRAGLPPKAVFVQRPEKMNAFHANIDNDLHESLRHMGYRLADSPVDAYIITYDTKPLPAGSANNVLITLHVHDKLGEDSKMLTQESGEFYIQGAEQLKLPKTSFTGVHIPSDTNE